MFIPDPGTKKMGEMYLIFMVAINFTKMEIILFLNRNKQIEKQSTKN
jgi:hypothetical protein